jgi:DNA-binding CsgD family transcriptional regulator
MAKHDDPPAAALALPPLIGREHDLATLLPAIDAATAGSGGTIVLYGTGGVGKTRLAEALVEEAQRRGFRVVAGRAFPFESGVPYALFADAFMPLVRDFDAGTLATLTRGAEAELSLLLPGLGAAVRAQQSDDPAELRGRLLWTVTEFVGRLAAREPLLLLFDDLHWADLSTLELLHFLARQAQHMPVLIVCTYNETERGQRPELRVIEQSLLAMGLARVHHVAPLSEQETSELVRRTFGVQSSITRDFCAMLFSWTQGNVFFVRETLQSLVESGRLQRREDGRWTGWDQAELELPGTIRDAIVARLSRLGTEARTVADVAAVIGTRFDHELLRAAIGADEAALLAGIDELRRLHIILESTGGSELRYDFAHPMLRQAIYAELGTARARGLHRNVAEAMERRSGAAAIAHADELAFHFSRAETGALEPKAVQYLHAAGCHALERFADREAADYLRLALERWSADAAIPHAAIVSALARAHQRLGEYDTAIDLIGRLLPAHVDETNAAGAAALHRRLGQAFYWSGRHVEGLHHYRTGAEILARTAGGPEEAVLRLAAGVCLQELGRAEDAYAEIDTALRIADAAGDIALLARTHRALLLLHIWTGPPDEGRRHGARAVELARAAGDATTEFFSEWGLAVLEGLTGHTDRMASHLEATERIAEQLRSPLLRLWTAELSIELNAAVGEWDRGIELGEYAIRLARSLNQRTLLPRLLVWTALIYLGRAELERAREYIDEAWEVSGADRTDGPIDVHSVVPAHIGRAAYHLYTRDFAETIRVCERGLEIADRTGYAFWAMHRLLPILAEAHCHLWDVEGALAVEARIRRDAERLGHRVGLAWADTCRALVVWLQGDPAGASRLIRDACEQLESIPMLPDAARLRRQLAGRLAETGDREGALLELKKVHQMFERMGAQSELTKARGMFREIGAKPPSLATSPGAEGLTGREVEIACMVAARKSNKAIGKALDISPRTVSTHLSNIFRKLNVSSRGELADYVKEHGVG